MYVLVTYRDEENQMKNEGARVVTTLYRYFSCSRAANSVAGGFKLLWKFLLPTNKEDPFKNEGARVVTTDLPL